jgi:hypothetical protein
VVLLGAPKPPNGAGLANTELGLGVSVGVVMAAGAGVAGTKACSTGLLGVVGAPNVNGLVVAAPKDANGTGTPLSTAPFSVSGPDISKIGEGARLTPFPNIDVGGGVATPDAGGVNRDGAGVVDSADAFFFPKSQGEGSNAGGSC